MMAKQLRSKTQSVWWVRYLGNLTPSTSTVASACGNGKWEAFVLSAMIIVSTVDVCFCRYSSRTWGVKDLGKWPTGARTQRWWIRGRLRLCVCSLVFPVTARGSLVTRGKSARGPSPDYVSKQSRRAAGDPSAVVLSLVSGSRRCTHFDFQLGPRALRHIVNDSQVWSSSNSRGTRHRLVRTHE